MTEEGVLALRHGSRHEFGVWLFKTGGVFGQLRKYLGILEGSWPGKAWILMEYLHYSGPCIVDMYLLYHMLTGK